LPHNDTCMKNAYVFLFFVLAAFLLSADSLHAQFADELSTGSRRARRAYEQAEEAYRLYDHEMAISMLDRAINIDDDFIEAWVLKAEILFQEEEFEKAITPYERALAIDDLFFPPARYYLGKALFHTAQYDEASSWIASFLEMGDADSYLYAQAEDALLHAEFAREAVRNPVPFDPENPGPAVNSEYAEYSPALTADERTLIFTRKKPMEGMELHDDLPRDYFFEDFYVSYFDDGGWTPARNMGAPLNTSGNEGAQTITADGRHMYFTACNRPDGIGRCDIYYSHKTGQEWSRPVNAGRPLNSPAWDSQPAVTADGNTIYFASSREGGIGTIDIWKAEKKEDGQWGTPVNLGKPVNTSGTELSPFIHHDSKSLYFASDGHPGMGGLDVFVSTRDPDSGEWTDPVNLGYPINTRDDEFAFIVGASGRQAWFASDQEGGYGQSDLYTFELYEEVRPDPVTFMKGIVSDHDTGEPLKAKFELLRVADGEVIMEAASDAVDGSFLVALPTDKNLALNVSREGYLFFSEHFSYEGLRKATDPYVRDIRLLPVREGEAVVLRNIFFETDSYELKDTSQAELEKLLHFLQTNPDLEIEISGHTDSRGSYAHNKELSENRARSVRNYLADQGIPGKRIHYRGYADTKPIDTNETPEGRANNRRTEFEVVNSKGESPDEDQ